MVGTIVSADLLDATHQGKIVDRYASGYKLRFTDSSTPEDKFTEILDDEYVDNPSYKYKVELGRTLYMELRARNNDLDTTYVMMEAGSYDPDHAAGGQSAVPYASPYVHTLPNLQSTGSLTLTPNDFGFDVVIGGWNDGGEQTAHEFEIATTTNSSVDWNADSDGYFGVSGRGRNFSFGTTQSRSRAVAVRPVQNKQVVGTAISDSVVSGGGGIQPNDRSFGPITMHIATFSDITIGTLSGSYYPLTGSVESPADSDAVIGTTASLYGWLSYAPGPKVMTDSAGVEFKMAPGTWDGTNLAVRLTPVDGSSVPTTGAGAKINTSQAGRKYTITGIPIDVQITGVALDVERISDSTNYNVDNTNPARFRLFQDTDAARTLYDNFTFFGEAPTQENINVAVLSSQGARAATFDFFDLSEDSPGVPTSGAEIANRAGITAEVIVYYRSITQKDDETLL